MTLAPGTKLGPYELLSPIGAGGMGEVYRARDPRVGRDVAIKVSSEQFSDRFTREIHAVAALNHSNVCTLYDVGPNYLVMELIEGPTLADRIKKGPIPLEESLEIARQIADALEAAHEKGIVHRDLKPGNIKIRPDGTVKVLDFGLAKVEETAAVSLETSPTLSMAQTAAGVLLGTAAYMSPEQARGKPVDKRADIWAFGVVLYEMLTGKQLFSGETVSDTLAATLKEEPDFGKVPAKVRPLLRRCLEKDPKKRLRDIGDAMACADSAPGSAPVKRPWLAWSVAAILFAALAATALVHFRQKSLALAEPVVTTTIKIEPGHWLAGILALQRPSRTAMAISSDGRFIVYSAIEENPGPQAKSNLYLRRMDQSEAKPIAGTEGGINPFLSPDDRWVGFWAGQKLKKVPVEGGVATSLCDASSIHGANWSRDNSIVFADGFAVGLSTVSADGGKPESLTKPDLKREEYGHSLPSWLPNGKAVLFTVMRQPLDSQPWIALLRLDTREWHVLLQDAADARYVSAGYMVFLRQGTLMAARFDPDRLKVIGQPVALVANVLQAFNPTVADNTAAGHFGVSETGSLIYAAGGIFLPPNNSLVWVDQRGIEQPVTVSKLPFFTPRLSPDGRRIAYMTRARERQVWVFDLDRGANSRLTSEGMAWPPIWTPDGKRLLFAWQKALLPNLFWQPYDGSLPMERFLKTEYALHAGTWSADRETIAGVTYHQDTNFDIAFLDVRSRRETPFLNSQFNETHPEFSPDGRWIAYSSDESKRSEVYVQPYPGPGTKYQVSNEGGTEPIWAKNGRQIFYRWQDQVWVVDIPPDGGFSPSKPRRLFEKSGYSSASPGRGWDLSHDGQRFLMVKLDQSKPTPITEINLVQNWLEELKRLLPAGKR